jgi:predicted DNA-binding transcriptional regulator AlpA
MEQLQAIERELLRDHEAAALCGVGRTTWHTKQAKGEAPAPIKAMGKRRWRRAELLAWIEAGCPPRREWDARRAMEGRR